MATTGNMPTTGKRPTRRKDHCRRPASAISITTTSGRGAAAAAGDLVLDPRASEAVPQRLEGLHVAHEPFPQLTAREREVLDLMAAGLPNATIARRIGISSKTVANHAANTTLKLPARDRSHAVIIARDAGLGRHLDDA